MGGVNADRRRLAEVSGEPEILDCSQRIKLGANCIDRPDLQLEVRPPDQRAPRIAEPCRCRNAGNARHDRPLGEFIKLIVQVLDGVLRFCRGEFFVCHMTADA